MGTLILMVFMIKNDFCAVMPSLQRGQLSLHSFQKKPLTFARANGIA